MCNPIAIAVASVIISTASTVASANAQADQAQAQYDAAETNYINQVNTMMDQSVEAGDQVKRERMANQREALKTSSAAANSFGASGIDGNTTSMIERNILRTQAENDYNLSATYEAAARAQEREMEHLAKATNAGMQAVATPDPFATALEIGGKALGAYAQYDQTTQQRELNKSQMDYYSSKK